MNLLGGRGGHFLDVHPARGARHEHRLAGRTIEHHAQVELALHLQAFFDEHAPDDTPLGAGLVRDERHADHLFRDRLGFVGRLGELDAAALSAAAGVNLRLDDDDMSAETTGDLARFGSVERDFTARHRHTVAREYGFGLILVDFHLGV